MRADPARQEAMLIALAFNATDVDGFLDSMTHEQFEEWKALFHLHPQGWRALNMVATRIAWSDAQKTTKKELSEADFAIRVAIPASDMPKVMAARAEALAIRGAILNGLPNG